MTEDTIRRVNLFVPGRVCLLGEHSDWAGGFKKDDFVDRVHRGQCLAYGTDVGIHAHAARVDHEDHQEESPTLHYYGDALPAGVAPLAAPLEPNTLRAVAAQGGFYSYVCGTAAVMLERMGRDKVTKSTVKIDNHTTTMPMKKGLSSSAAVCVLVARAFSQLYDFPLTVEEEMDIAYLGERLTPSRCGRMDQCCAFGPKFVSMIFDGDAVISAELVCPAPIHFVIADLNAAKDTKVILAKLTEAYPSPESPVHESVHKFLGPVSWNITERAKIAIAEGDPHKLGEIFDEAQDMFDHHLIPACPEQLTSPRLHEVLRHASVRAHVLGGKGVGSQGDGSVQFVCRDAETQRATVAALEALGCHPFPLTVGHQVASNKH